MFDNNHIEESDLLLRAILENGQEEVPDRLWKGIAEGLDRVDRRRKILLWIGRSAAAVAAAAVAVGVFFRYDTYPTLVPEAEGDMIAVVEEPADSAPEEVLIAEVRKTVTDHGFKVTPQEIVTEQEKIAADKTTHTTSTAPEAVPEEVITAETGTEKPHVVDNRSSADNHRTVIADAWEDEDASQNDNKIKVSLVLSGIAGTNGPQNNRNNVFKSPGILKAPTKTTVTPTSSDIAYGIPLSFGTGVKLHFTPKWSLSVGLNYSMLTSRFDGKYQKVEEGLPELDVTFGKVRNTLHYIGVPINAYYDILNGDFINFYAYAGGTVEKCVANRYQVLATPVINHSEQVKGVQLSVNAGIGVEFMLGRYVGIYLDPSLRYYFNCRQPKSIRTAQPLMLGFEMGLRFNL